MKAILISSILFLSLPYASAEPLNEGLTVKVIDGTTARCDSASDFLDVLNRQGAYRVTAKNVNISKDKLSFDLNFEFLSCALVDSKYEFIPQSPYSPYSYDFPKNEDELSKIEITPVAETALLRGFNDFKPGVILVDRVLPDSANTVIHVNLNWSDVVWPADSGIDLPEGVKERASVDFNVVRTVNITTQNPLSEMVDVFRYGLFRVIIDLK